jgi:hypothetical protein
MCDFTWRYKKWGYPYYFATGRTGILSPSENWVAFNKKRRGYDVFYVINNKGLILSDNLDDLNAQRKYYLKDDYKNYKQYIDTPVALIFTKNQSVVDEIKERKKLPPGIPNPSFDNNTKHTSDTPSVGGDQYHLNMQSNVAMNFIIKY